MSVAEYRDQIRAADREVLAAVNRRVELVRALHEYKRAEGIPLRDLAREEQIVVELQAANDGPLSSRGVAELARFVLELTRRELDA